MASGKKKEFQLQFTHIQPDVFMRKLAQRLENDDRGVWFVDVRSNIRLLAPEYIDQGALSCTLIPDCVVVRAHNSQFAVEDCRHVFLGKFLEMVFDLRDRTLTPYIKHMATGPLPASDITMELVPLRGKIRRAWEGLP